MKPHWIVWLAAIFAASLAGQASGQEYPNKPVTLIVPYAPGGGADIIARTLQNKMGEVLRQPLIIETRPGAATTIGAAAVARAAPDGYTVLLTTLPAFPISALTVPNVPYHALDSFAPIGQMAIAMPNLVIVSASSGIKSMQDLVAAAKAKPKTITYGTTGVGTGVHLIAELLSSLAGVQFIHVPYNGASPAMMAVLGGHVDFAVVDGGTLLGAREQLRLLGAASTKRMTPFLEVPTLIEQGFPVDMDTAVVLLAPAKTPPAIVQKIHDALRETVNSSDVNKKFGELGYEIAVTSSDELVRRLTRDLDQFGKIVKRASPTAQ